MALLCMMVSFSEGLSVNIPHQLRKQSNLLDNSKWKMKHKMKNKHLLSHKKHYKTCDSACILQDNNEKTQFAHTPPVLLRAMHMAGK